MFLTFGVEVEEAVKVAANKQGIPIFGQGMQDESDDTLYRLLEVTKKHLSDAKAQKKTDMYSQGKVAFPAKLQILTKHVKKSDEVIIGVSVLRGQLRVGTPVGIPCPERFMKVGRVCGIHTPAGQPVNCALAGSDVSIKIENPAIQFGRHHFVEGATLISHITQSSAAVLEDVFDDEIRPGDAELLRRLKAYFK